MADGYATQLFYFASRLKKLQETEEALQEKFLAIVSLDFRCFNLQLLFVYFHLAPDFLLELQAMKTTRQLNRTLCLSIPELECAGMYELLMSSPNLMLKIVEPLSEPDHLVHGPLLFTRLSKLLFGHNSLHFDVESLSTSFLFDPEIRLLLVGQALMFLALLAKHSASVYTICTSTPASIMSLLLLLL